MDIHAVITFSLCNHTVMNILYTHMLACLPISKEHLLFLKKSDKSFHSLGSINVDGCSSSSVWGGVEWEGLELGFC